jgi:hypothetical protein
MRALRKTILAAATAAMAITLALPATSFAAHNRGGRHWSGTHRPGYVHHPRFYPRSTFFFGFGASPWLYGYPYGYPGYPYYPYPYPYPYPAEQPPPTTFIEKFDGTPSAGMSGIVCPDSGRSYPEVTECAGGWARVIEHEELAQPAG